MAKRSKPRPRPSSAPTEPPGPNRVHSSLYLPRPVYEALRETAFHERRKIHDLIMEGIDAVLKQISICRGPQSGQKAMNEPCQVWGGALGEGVAGYTSDAASAFARPIVIRSPRQRAPAIYPARRGRAPSPS